jgi:uncharacterized protein YndB with AHSA1/START domain
MKMKIRQEFFYEHPLETIWDFLTKPELMSQWLMENDFALIPGHEFQFRTNPYPDLGFDGIFSCQVVEIVPLKRLSYTWKAGPRPGTVSLDTLVVWTLIQKPNGTQLVLEHSGFEERNRLMYTSMTAGWLKHMQTIGERITTNFHDASPA